MATNTIATPLWTTKEVAREFMNSLKFLAHVNRTYDDQYVISGAKVGRTVNARLPQLWEAKDGETLQLQAIFDQTVPITLTNQKQVAFSYSSAEATTALDDIRRRYTRPGGNTLANAAEVLAFNAVYRDIYQAVGTPGTTPTTAQTYLNAGVKLTDSASGEGERVAVLDSMAMASLANTSATLFNPQNAISGNWRKGQMGANQLGVDAWYTDVNRPTHTTGTFTASTPLVNGADQTGSSVITDGWASGASSLKKGDIFTMGGVYQVNPISKQSTGRLQQFAVTADLSDTTGAMTIGITPSIITSGQLQNVTNSPANDAVITVWSANPAGGTLATTVSPQSFVYLPDAFAFVMADLVKPTAGAKAETVTSKQLGFSIRMVEQYQIGTDQNPSRLDILIGAATLQARLACRVVG